MFRALKDFLIQHGRDSLAKKKAKSRMESLRNLGMQIGLKHKAVNLFKKKVQIAGIGEIEVDADPMEA